MGNPHAIGEAFQITCDETLTWNQIHQTIADALGTELRVCHVASDYLAAAGQPFGYDFEGPLLGDKAVSVVFDNRKLKRIVPDMRTTVPFERGVRIALDYIMSHPECRTEDPEFDAWCDRVIGALEESKKLFIEIRHKLSTLEFRSDSEPYTITLTFGVETFSEGVTFDEMIQHADDYLYMGKQNGRDCIVYQNFYWRD
jgi:hypothetical protein